MSGAACDLCTAPVPDQAYVCPKCTARTVEDLERIVDLAGEVESVVAKLVRYGGASKVGGERPLPFDEKAGERAAAIGNTVATWARHVAESRGLSVPAPTLTLGPLCRHGMGCRHDSCERIRTRYRDVGVAAAAAWLLDQLEWLRHQAEAAEAFGDLREASRTLEHVVGRPPDRWFAGQCWELVDGQRCEQELYAPRGASTVRCRACGFTHDAQHRRDWLLDQARDQLLHAEWIARALTALGIEKVTGSRIRNLADRGRLANHGTDASGRPKYRVGEVLDLIDEQAKVEAERAAKREDKARRKAERQDRAA